MKRVATLLGVAMAFSLLILGCSSVTGYNAASGDKQSDALFDTGHEMFACRPNNYDAKLCQ
jgi:hypothetical protein